MLDVSRQTMAPLRNTYTGHLWAGHSTSAKIASDCRAPELGFRVQVIRNKHS